MSQRNFRLEIGDGGRIVEQSVGQLVHEQLAAHLVAIQSLFQTEVRASLTDLERDQRAWVRSHLQDQHVQQVIELAKRARKDFSVLVTIGIGGSDLSARVFHDVLNPAYHNLLPESERGEAPEVYFTGDTFDPCRLNGLLSMLKQRQLLDKTLFNVISKSGRTGETIATLMIVRDWLQKQSGITDPEEWRRQVVATTGLDSKSALYQLHQQNPFYGDVLLPVPEGVGGRFSAFSPVGLFFLAMTAGKGESPEMLVREALGGVREADELFRKPYSDADNAAYRLARWLHVAEVWGGKGTLVFYNYADDRCLGDWLVQLYEESIQERGQGLNVIAARGPTSNHSILNGILGGPRDKVVLFIQWENLGDDLTIPTNTGISGEMEVFEGLTMSQVQTASYRGTAEDFTTNGIPNVTLVIPKRDARNLCKLMRVLMDTVAVKGRLQGLYLNDAGLIDLTQELTYRQDGVEGYKEKTREEAKQMQIAKAESTLLRRAQ